MRYIKFWLVGGERIESVRGWCEQTQTRYEIWTKDHQWECLEVVSLLNDDGWTFRPVATGDLFECMQAAETHAISAWQQSESEYQPE